MTICYLRSFDDHNSLAKSRNNKWIQVHKHLLSWHSGRVDANSFDKLFLNCVLKGRFWRNCLYRNMELPNGFDTRQAIHIEQCKLNISQQNIHVLFYFCMPTLTWATHSLPFSLQWADLLFSSVRILKNRRASISSKYSLRGPVSIKHC